VGLAKLVAHVHVEPAGIALEQIEPGLPRPGRHAACTPRSLPTHGHQDQDGRRPLLPVRHAFGWDKAAWPNGQKERNVTAILELLAVIAFGLICLSFFPIGYFLLWRDRRRAEAAEAERQAAARAAAERRAVEEDRQAAARIAAETKNVCVKHSVGRTFTPLRKNDKRLSPVHLPRFRAIGPLTKSRKSAIGPINLSMISTRLTLLFAVNRLPTSSFFPRLACAITRRVTLR